MSTNPKSSSLKRREEARTIEKVLKRLGPGVALTLVNYGGGVSPRAEVIHADEQHLHNAAGTPILKYLREGGSITDCLDAGVTYIGSVWVDKKVSVSLQKRCGAGPIFAEAWRGLLLNKERSRPLWQAKQIIYFPAEVPFCPDTIIEVQGKLANLRYPRWHPSGLFISSYYEV